MHEWRVNERRCGLGAFNSKNRSFVLWSKNFFPILKNLRITSISEFFVSVFVVFNYFSDFKSWSVVSFDLKYLTIWCVMKVSFEVVFLNGMICCLEVNGKWMFKLVSCFVGGFGSLCRFLNESLISVLWKCVLKLYMWQTGSALKLFFKHQLFVEFMFISFCYVTDIWLDNKLGGRNSNVSDICETPLIDVFMTKLAR